MTEAVTRKRRCRHCGTAKTLDEYISTDTRTSRICQTCVALHNAASQVPKWDWAKAVHKSTSMSESRRALHEDARCDYNAALTDEKLRSVMICQGYRCPITQYAFHLPEVNELKLHQTLNDWREGLTPDVAAVTPVLVRADVTLPWAPGNVFFIAYAWQHIYSTCTGWAEFRKMLYTAYTHTFQIPDQTALARLDLERLEQRMAPKTV